MANLFEDIEDPWNEEGMEGNSPGSGNSPPNKNSIKGRGVQPFKKDNAYFQMDDNGLGSYTATPLHLTP